MADPVLNVLPPNFILAICKPNYTVLPLSVVVKMPESLSGQPGWIPGAPDGQPSVIGSCPPLVAAKVKRRRGDKSNSGFTEKWRAIPYDIDRL